MSGKSSRGTDNKNAPINTTPERDEANRKAAKALRSTGLTQKLKKEGSITRKDLKSMMEGVGVLGLSAQLEDNMEGLNLNNKKDGRVTNKPGTSSGRVIHDLDDLGISSIELDEKPIGLAVESKSKDISLGVATSHTTHGLDQQSLLELEELNLCIDEFLTQDHALCSSKEIDLSIHTSQLLTNINLMIMEVNQIPDSQITHFSTAEGKLVLNYRVKTLGQETTTVIAAKPKTTTTTQEAKPPEPAKVALPTAGPIKVHQRPNRDTSKGSIKLYDKKSGKPLIVSFDTAKYDDILSTDLSDTQKGLNILKKSGKYKRYMYSHNIPQLELILE